VHCHIQAQESETKTPNQKNIMQHFSSLQQVQELENLESLRNQVFSVDNGNQKEFCCLEDSSNGLD